jgi:hypothetical protein
MAGSQPSAPADRAVSRPRRSPSTLAAFLIGVPLATGLLAFVNYGPLRDTPLQRYVSHKVECVEVLMFCMALGALLAKLASSWTERRACRREILPPWDGKAVGVAEAGKLLAGLSRLPGRLQNTLIVERAAAVLEFLCSRGSAAELDDHLRTLVDNDSVTLEGSYSLTRFITWAIPILGFLGTVVGITQAIAGVNPEVLEKDLSQVTGGLSEAFDTTALALALTMVAMFLSFLVERVEQSILDTVDRYADRELAHRFERTGPEGGEFVEVVRRNTDVLVGAVEQLVQKQTALWAQALEAAERRRQEADQRHQQSLTACLEAALDHTLETHAKRLTVWEKQAAEQSGKLAEQLASLAAAVRETGREHQTALAQITQGVASQVKTLTELQEGEKNLRRLQETLNQNLASLAGAGTFEQTMHTLTAAIHLLTARAAAPSVTAGRLGPRPGAAA